jgi:hypothetical protein
VAILSLDGEKPASATGSGDIPAFPGKALGTDQQPQLMVVLRIADRDGVVGRKAERAESRPQPRSFADRLGKHHQAASIEQQHERDFEFPMSQI